MRVVCMVPSWTETLVACGVNVVGRTRYCIHPARQVANITVVGGTKDVQWEKVALLAPDLVIFDKEENTKAMADSCPYSYFATDITTVQQMPEALAQLAEQLDNAELLALAQRYSQVLSKPLAARPEQLPLLEHSAAASAKVLTDERPWLYLIWRNPYMGIGRRTFIASVFSHLGFKDKLLAFDENYPAFTPEQLMALTPVLLCSTEPYPFAKQLEITQQELALDAVLLDGEPLCWYGIRCLHYLESVMNQS